MKFTDGMEIKTDGELRMVRKSDGLYVAGQGMLIPVDSREEAMGIITKENHKEHGGAAGSFADCPLCN